MNAQRALLAVVVLLALGCGAAPMSGAGAGVASPRVEPAMLVPIDENGNVHGPVGPWAFFFDLDDERVHPGLASTATEIATYMNAHPSIKLRIDGSGPPTGTDAQTLVVRQRRITAIRDALVTAGVPPDRISLGVAPSRVR